MSYSDFDLPRAQSEFSLTLHTTTDMFAGIRPVPVDPAAQATLQRQIRLAVATNTEKARSEWLIAPLLGELWRHGESQISILSGVPLDVDADVGLVGRCDFVIGRPPQLHYVTAPLMVIIEAKNEDVAGGLGQCAATMVGAQRFNFQHKTEIETIHGCVSSGTEWRFLRLTRNSLSIDMMEYHISQAEQLLGIFLHVLGLPPRTLAAA